jgi:hypothetical protein
MACLSPEKLSILYEGNGCMRITVLLLSLLITSLPAFGGDEAGRGQLMPGKPAGVQKAQTDSDVLLYTYGGVALFAGLVFGVIALSGNPGTVAAATGTTQ